MGQLAKRTDEDAPCGGRQSAGGYKFIKEGAKRTSWVEATEESDKFGGVEEVEAARIVAIDEPAEAFRAQRGGRSEAVTGIKVHRNIAPASTVSSSPVT